MKNMFLIILAVVFCFSFSATAMAGGIKPPKEICFKANIFENYFCLAIKPSGSVKFKDKQKTKYYTIDGSMYNYGDATHWPIGGTGHMEDNLFKFHLSGQFVSGDPVFISAFGHLDLSLDRSDGLITIMELSTFHQSAGDYELIEVPCSDYDAPPVMPLL